MIVSGGTVLFSMPGRATGCGIGYHKKGPLHHYTQHADVCVAYVRDCRLLILPHMIDADATRPEQISRRGLPCP